MPRKSKKPEEPADQPSGGTSEVTIDPTMERLINQALEQVHLGKMDLADVIEALASDRLQPDTTAPEAVSVPAITEEQRQALSEIVDLYGKVAPKSPRALSTEELRDIVTERECVDTILAFLKKRKDESIREALANHFDRHAEKNPEIDHENAAKDKRGHYATKQEESVSGTGKKICRIVSGGKPQITAEGLHQAWKDGILTRAEYLALTSQPEVPRVFDSAKANRAIKKDKSLLFKMAQASRDTAPTTTIKVNNDT